MLLQPRRRSHCYSSAWALRDVGPDSESTQVRHSITIHSWETRRRPRAHFAELLPVGLLVAADGRQPNDQALPLCDTAGVGVIVASRSAAAYAWISEFCSLPPTLRFPHSVVGSNVTPFHHSPAHYCGLYVCIVEMNSHLQGQNGLLSMNQQSFCSFTILDLW